MNYFFIQNKNNIIKSSITPLTYCPIVIKHFSNVQNSLLMPRVIVCLCVYTMDQKDFANSCMQS